MSNIWGQFILGFFCFGEVVKNYHLAFAFVSAAEAALSDLAGFTAAPAGLVSLAGLSTVGVITVVLQLTATS